MSARPARLLQAGTQFRVVAGSRRRRPTVAPWLLFASMVVLAMLGMVLTRTALDTGAFELADLEVQIMTEERRQEVLVLEVARKESPARVGPLAEAMGLVYPIERQVLLVQGITLDGGDGEFDPTRLALESRPG